MISCLNRNDTSNILTGLVFDKTISDTSGIISISMYIPSHALRHDAQGNGYVNGTKEKVQGLKKGRNNENIWKVLYFG
jgi:hypothetical protein